jgi:hypothetical protein
MLHAVSCVTRNIPLDADLTRANFAMMSLSFPVAGHEFEP